MNLLHKGEFAGNLPKIKMIDYGVTIIRPLIYISEEEIRRYARKHGFESWVWRGVWAPSLAGFSQCGMFRR